jgi:GNAT superfamily N-acetyltransferase
MSLALHSADPAWLTMPQSLTVFPPAALGQPHVLRPAVLTVDDIDHVVHLHEEVVRLAPPGTVRHDPPSFFHRIAAGDGAMLGYLTEDGALAAYGVLSLPRPEGDHYGRPLHLPAAAWPQLAQLEGAAVAPNWRGHGLQRQLGQWRIALAAELGRRHIAVTVAPSNVDSWRNMLQLGFAICDVLPMYGGQLRYLMHRDLRETAALKPVRCVAVDDAEALRLLFTQGWRATGWRGRPPAALLLAPPREA